jgi:ATP-binding cassette subfamily B (MDR/TAP) protein 1
MKADNSTNVVDSATDSSSSKKKATATLTETFGFAYRCGWKTRLLFVTGTLGGIAHGLALPMVAYFLSRTFETMSKISGDARDDTRAVVAEDALPDPMDAIREISYTFLVLGVYTLVCAFVETASFELMAVHATRLFQLEWFTALLRQDAAYFDIHTSANTAPTSILRYRQGLGRRFGELIENLTTGIAGVCLGLYSSWKVSLLVFAILPLISAASLNWIRVNQSKTQRAQECYQQANSTAYFTVSSLRTVLSLNALPKMIAQYQTATQLALESACSVLIQLGFFGGAVMAAVICLFVGVILFGSFVMYDDLRDTGCNPAG